ncbi:hypothetical protein ACLB1Q_13545 [Escherichia coli]
MLELAQLAPGELRTLLQPFMGADNGKPYTHVAISTIARSNRYNRAFCPAVPSSISPDRRFRPAHCFDNNTSARLAI